MSETAKVLQFPARRAASLCALDALRESKAYFDRRSGDGAEERRAGLLETPEVLQSLCSLLRERVDEQAAEVCDEAEKIYRVISASKSRLGVFDERDYFLGDSALIAGTANRLLGQRNEAELWFER